MVPLLEFRKRKNASFENLDAEPSGPFGVAGFPRFFELLVLDQPGSHEEGSGEGVDATYVPVEEVGSVQALPPAAWY